MGVVGGPMVGAVCTDWPLAAEAVDGRVAYSSSSTTETAPDLEPPQPCACVEHDGGKTEVSLGIGKKRCQINKSVAVVFCCSGLDAALIYTLYASGI